MISISFIDLCWFLMILNFWNFRKRKICFDYKKNIIEILRFSVFFCWKNWVSKKIIEQFFCEFSRKNVVIIFCMSKTSFFKFSYNYYWKGMYVRASITFLWCSSRNISNSVKRCQERTFARSWALQVFILHLY